MLAFRKAPSVYEPVQPLFPSPPWPSAAQVAGIGVLCRLRGKANPPTFPTPGNTVHPPAGHPTPLSKSLQMPQTCALLRLPVAILTAGQIALGVHPAP